MTTLVYSIIVGKLSTRELIRTLDRFSQFNDFGFEYEKKSFSFFEHQVDVRLIVPKDKARALDWAMRDFLDTNGERV